MIRFLISYFSVCVGLFAQKEVVYKSAAVASARIEASEIGAEVMRNGGNAFDAMVAVELALAVCYPYAGNISGGGFMVYVTPDQKVGCLDYRETAPSAAREFMYLNADGNVVPGLNKHGALSVAIPGTIAGLFEVHKKFGTVPIKTLFQPAIQLAKKGVIVTALTKSQWDRYKNDINNVSKSFMPFGENLKVGDTIRFPALAKTLERISVKGRNEFYEGKTARELVRSLRKFGGIVSKSDLKNYRAVWREPISFSFKEYEIHSMSPPSSGGVVLAQLFGMLRHYDLSTISNQSLKYVQLLTELERRAYADRSKFLGDPDFVKIPIKELLDNQYLTSRTQTIDFNHASKSSEVNPGSFEQTESNETTHYSIADSFGNVVSVTTTLNGAFGSKLYLDSLGFFINNQMDDFSAKPNEANSYGLTGSAANKIEPKKRMLSSMTPTIVCKNGKPVLALGSPGGSTIITTVFQTLVNVLQYDLPLQAAIDLPRFHHQWKPDEILFEEKFPSTHFAALTQLGYKVKVGQSPVIGKVDAIFIDSLGNKHAAADKRGEDATAGF